MTSNDVLEIYRLLLKNNLVSFPLTEEAKHKVEATIANITQTHFGVEFYSSVEEKAVAHLYFLIKNHAFTDGNKRTASITFLTICGINGITPDFSKFGLDELAVYIEQLKEENHQQIMRVIAAALFGWNFLDTK